MKNMLLLCGGTFLLGAGIAALTSRRPKTTVESVGVLTGPRNPCNLLIEAHRVDNKLAAPDREMRMVYYDLNDPAIVAECAINLSKRAKTLGQSSAAANAALREGVKSWYKPEGPVSYSGTRRGSITFGAA